MTSDEFRKLTDQFNEQGKMNFLEGATEDQISQFEKDNDIVLPSKYKEWLVFCDGGEFFLPAGVQMYGIAHKPLIDTDDDRPDDNYVVIGSLAAGDPILCEKSGERISIYNHEADRIEDDEVYEDFFAFLNDLTEILGIGG
ncbi:SMI1/KNR4 family protein [Anaerostipes butyraticus]|uniref:SMI1/KNR4 family protein n=1 Tax=Anaerostipes butyraticus TaxID=645466 RepID=UPI003207C9A2